MPGVLTRKKAENNSQREKRKMKDAKEKFWMHAIPIIIILLVFSAVFRIPRTCDICGEWGFVGSMIIKEDQEWGDIYWDSPFEAEYGLKGTGVFRYYHEKCFDQKYETEDVSWCSWLQAFNPIATGIVLILFMIGVGIYHKESKNNLQRRERNEIYRT